MSAAGGIREATLDDILDPGRYEHIARVLEAAKFDACFFADLFGLYDLHQGSFDAYVRRGGQISYLDPDRGAAGDGRRDAPSRPRRHALDQLSHRLSSRALARLARCR